MARTTEPGIDFGSWLGTIQKVIDIAGAILPILAADAAPRRNGRPAATTGKVAWNYDLTHQKVEALNETDEEISLCFANCEVDDGGRVVARSLQHAVAAGHKWDATRAIANFALGHITANPTKLPGMQNDADGTDSVTLSVGYLPLNTMSEIFGGWYVQVFPGDGDYRISMVAGKHVPFTVMATIRDIGGNTGTAKAHFKAGEDSNTFPVQGVDLSSGIMERLDVVLEVPSEVYQEVTRTQRAELVRVPRPVGATSR